MSTTKSTRKLKRGEALVGSEVVRKGSRLYPYGYDRLSLEIVSVTADGRLKVRPIAGGATRVITTTNARKNYGLGL